MYHRQVSSSPRPVEAIICSSVGAPAPEVCTAKVRLSMAGVTGTPAAAAECRDDTSAASEPSLIHDVGLSGSPLSNTEELAPDACAITNGAHASPGARGALDSVTGWEGSRPPIPA